MSLLPWKVDVPKFPKDPTDIDFSRTSNLRFSKITFLLDFFHQIDSLMFMEGCSIDKQVAKYVP